MSTINQDTTLWCDMDGVVAVYDADGFRGKNPPFLIPDSHYFRDCTPDMRIIKALQLLHDVYHVKIKIISNIDVTLKQEHHTDKYNWLKKYICLLSTLIRIIIQPQCPKQNTLPESHIII